MTKLFAINQVSAAEVADQREDFNLAKFQDRWAKNQRLLLNQQSCHAFVIIVRRDNVNVVVADRGQERLSSTALRVNKLKRRR